MCGIAGQINYRASAIDVNELTLLAVRDAMQTRGPDGAGIWIAADHRTGLAHRRLSIIDLSAASDQPLSINGGDAVIVFNGEIYNYQLLRAELSARGVNFTTQGDTEVLAQLLRLDGWQGLRKLRGMYAFAYHDTRTGRSVLARDPYGIKPLYYADTLGALSFASSVKALAHHPHISRSIDPVAEVGFLLTGSVPEPHTILSDIKALPPGHVLLVEPGLAPQLRCFEALADYYGAQQTAADERELHSALLDSVRAHMVADVDVGSFLSSGVDSGALLGLMRDAGANSVRSLTVRFQEFAGMANDEGPLAETLAQRYGATHREAWVSQADFAADWDAFSDAMDQPSIDGMNTWMVSKAARAAGLKVAISGLGGDELLGGYPSFQDLPRWQRRTAWLRWLPARTPMVNALIPLLRWTGLHPKSAGVLRYCSHLSELYALKRGLFIPEELPQLLARDRIEAGRAAVQQWLAPLEPAVHDDFAAISCLESTRYMRNQLLRDTDWASMAHSLEVRTPLVDRDLLRAIMPARVLIQRAGGKSLLASAPSTPLPQSITHRPKTGFSTPVARWQQSLPALQSWREFPFLSTQKTPWARRYAVAVWQQQKARFA